MERQPNIDDLIRGLDMERLQTSEGPTRERGLAQKYANQGKITTLMLRNIPSKYTQDMLLEELIDCMGSSDIFDFFYLPWDQQNNCNIGYAFVNFRTTAAAERCSRLFTNFSFRRCDSQKICRVYPAHIQGLENNVLHLMDRAVSEARSHYPIVMWKGEKLKLGKVIAALDSQHRTITPASAPGKFMGGRDHAGSSSSFLPRRQAPWPDAQIDEQFHMGGGGGGASSLFVGEGDFSDSPMIGTPEASLVAHLQFGMQGRRFVQRLQSPSSGPTGWDGWAQGAGSMDLHVPGVPSGCGGCGGDYMGQGIVAPATTPGRMLAPGQPNVPLQRLGPVPPGPVYPVEQPPSANARPPTSGMGGLVPSPQEAQNLACGGPLQAPRSLPKGPVLAMPQAPEGPQVPLPAEVSSCRLASSVQKMASMAPDDAGGCRTIELGSPDEDILNKFLARFGS